MTSLSLNAEDNRFIRVLHAQFEKAVREPNPYIVFARHPEKINTWYIKLHNFDGDHGEFKNGEFLFEMIAPNEFPMKPPHFYALTDNGVYKAGLDEEGKRAKICISIGEFHADNYPATLGMAGFAEQLLSGLIGWRSLGSGINVFVFDGMTINQKEKKTHEIKKISEMSKEKNLKNYEDILKLLDESYEEYSKKWDNADKRAKNTKNNDMKKKKSKIDDSGDDSGDDSSSDSDSADN